MFRNLFKNRNSSKLISNCLFNSIRSVYTQAQKESFMRSWSRMSESSRKQNAIVDNCPENAELLIYKGHAYKDMGAHHAAIEFYKQAAELDASYSAKADSEIKEIEDFLKNQSCRPSR